MKPFSDKDLLKFCGYESGRMNRYGDFMDFYLDNRKTMGLRESAETAMYKIGYKGDLNGNSLPDFCV